MTKPQRFAIYRVHDDAKMLEVVTLTRGCRELAEYFIGGTFQAAYELRDARTNQVFGHIGPGGAND